MFTLKLNFIDTSLEEVRVMLLFRGLSAGVGVFFRTQWFGMWKCTRI